MRQDIDQSQDTDAFQALAKHTNARIEYAKGEVLDVAVTAEGLKVIGTQSEITAPRASMSWSPRKRYLVEEDKRVKTAQRNTRNAARRLAKKQRRLNRRSKSKAKR
ncbi:MAG: hypothetical protein V3S69_00165 [Dehalococcoidales bacterium]